MTTLGFYGKLASRRRFCQPRLAAEFYRPVGQLAGGGPARQSTQPRRRLAQRVSGQPAVALCAGARRVRAERGGGRGDAEHSTGSGGIFPLAVVAVARSRHQSGVPGGRPRTAGLKRPKSCCSAPWMPVPPSKISTPGLDCLGLPATEPRAVDSRFAGLQRVAATEPHARMTAPRRTGLRRRQPVVGAWVRRRFPLVYCGVRACPATSDFAQFLPRTRRCDVDGVRRTNPRAKAMWAWFARSMKTRAWTCPRIACGWWPTAWAGTPRGITSAA